MSRGNQVTRQWRILRMLETSRLGMKVSELHAAFPEELSQRTLFRDLQHLQQAGFPLRAEPDGRWTLAAPIGAAARLPVLASEAFALAFCRELVAPLAGTELVDALDSLSQKVGATLTPIQRAFVDETRAAHVAQFTHTASLTHAALATIDVIEGAVAKQQRIMLCYQGRNGRQTRRIIEPYALWFADGQVYVIAHCRLRSAIRLFVPSRVVHAELLDDTFDPDPEFDARAYVGRGFRVWCGEVSEIELLFAPEVAHVPHERRLHGSQVNEPLPDGSVRVHMTTSGLPVLASWVAGFGGQVRVEQPALLQAMVRDIHRAGLEAATSTTPGHL